MSEFITSFIKKTKPQFQKYKKYIQNNDWSLTTIDDGLRDEFFIDYLSDDKKKNTKAEIAKFVKEKLAKQKASVKYKSDEFMLQNELVNSIIDRVKYLIKKSEGDHHLKSFKTFIKECLAIISIHTNRTDEYVNSFDISAIENQDVRSEEIKFLKDCFSSLSKISDNIVELNIKEDSTDAKGISFHENKPAPLSMCSILCELYPEIKRAVDAIGIDFFSPPNNEMHINNPNPPIYNGEKPFWQQDKDTLQYYVDEYKKCRDGITVDGFHINGWLYYHLNVFVTDVPEEYTNPNTGEKESKDVLKNPPLRDNEMYIISNYERAKKQEKMMFLAATRRAAKTTLIASKLDHAATIGKKTLLCAGGSAKDLGQIEKNFKTTILNKNPAFATYNLSNDWTKKISLGIKTKGGKIIPLSTLNVVNLNSGGEKSSEVLAGYTPDEFVLDEIMKAPFISQLEAVKPALDSPYGKRCVGILSGTGGNEDLAKDAMDVLNFPDVHDILEIQWDLLERGVPEEEITWRDDRRPFGTFLPAQMSAKVGMVKYDSNLAVYLNKPDSEELKKIKIKLTDWKKCNEIIAEDRAKKSANRTAYTKEVVYYPIKPSELFLSGKLNPFPVEEAKAHRDYLIQTGKWDRRRELFKDSEGKIHAKISTKELAKFPHRGGQVDAPVMLLEDLPEFKPKYGTYTAGFDDTKQLDSDTDSLTSFVVWKNEILGDPFSNKPVATLKFKPNRREAVYEQWLLLMEAFNLERTCFGENIDFEIKSYLDRFHLADKYLATSLDFSSTFHIPNNNKRKFGWNPSTSKKMLFELLVAYCNEKFEVEQEDGEILILKGVQRIDDISLLEEIIAYNENLNVDLITSAMGAYGYGHYLRSSYIWRTPTVKSNNVQGYQAKKVPAQPPKTYYSHPSKRRGFYRNR